MKTVSKQNKSRKQIANAKKKDKSLCKNVKTTPFMETLKWLDNENHWLSVLIMSRTRFRVNPHSIIAWISRNSLLKTGAISEVKVIRTGLEPWPNNHNNQITK